jgi:hypothetical protein
MPASDSQHVRRPCSIGCPVPRSDASDSATVNSANRPGPASSTIPTLFPPRAQNCWPRLVVQAGADGEEQGHEGVFVGPTQQRVGRSLPADGGDPLAAGGNGAERAGAVGGVDGQVVGQAQQPLLDRPPQRPGERPGELWRNEVGAGHRPDQQRSDAEQGDRAGTVAQ